jgi:hypothetical protein
MFQGSRRSSCAGNESMRCFGVEVATQWRVNIEQMVVKYYAQA